MRSCRLPKVLDELTEELRHQDHKPKDELMALFKERSDEFLALVPKRADV